MYTYNIHSALDLKLTDYFKSTLLQLYIYIYVGEEIDMLVIYTWMF